MKSNTIAFGVRVKLNETFKEKSLNDEALSEESVLYICDGHIYNDIKGDYVYIRGGSLINTGRAYLSELDLAFPIPEKPLY